MLRLLERTPLGLVEVLAGMLVAVLGPYSLTETELPADGAGPVAADVGGFGGGFEFAAVAFAVHCGARDGRLQSTKRWPVNGEVFQRGQ